MVQIADQTDQLDHLRVLFGCKEDGISLGPKAMSPPAAEHRRWAKGRRLKQ